MAEVTGVSSLKRKLTKALREHNERVAKALEEAGIKLLELSQPLVPVDTGLLKSTGKVTRRREGWDAVVEVSYGNDKAFYATWVHEDLDAFHLAGTQAKYLEQPLRENLDLLGDIIRKGAAK